MSSSKRKKLTPMQQQYQDFAHAREPQRPILKNCTRAFVSGGIICTIGQGMQWVFMTYFNFDEKTAGDPIVAVLILISVILTSLGLYDHIAQWGALAAPYRLPGLPIRSHQLL